MRKVAGDRDQFRFRLEREQGRRSVARTFAAYAAPRALTTGQQDSQSGGGDGSGHQFEGDISGTIDGTIGIPDAGEPDTGQRVAIWGLFVWDSAIDVFGA